MTTIEIILIIAIGGVFVYLFTKKSGSGGTGGGTGGGDDGRNIQR
jgi:hypothetical protein